MIDQHQDVEQRFVREMEHTKHPDLAPIRQSLALGAFVQNKMSLLEASQLAGVSVATFAEWAERSNNGERPHSQSQPPSARAVFAPIPTISVVVPVYNEESNIDALLERLLPVLQELGPYEVLFVNDGSKDRSVEIILQKRAQNPAIKLLSFSRNFGHQAALCAGIDHARGKAVVLMDADLQDPPELLRELVERWHDGYQVAYAVRQKRKENVFKRNAYFWFYRLMRSLANIDVPLDAGDFCLMDRAVVDRLLALPERTRFLRGLRSWVGFAQTGVPYERPARHAGETKYTLRKLMKLALDGLLSFSTVPLRFAVYLGFLTAALGIGYLFYVIGTRLFTDHVPAGWTSLATIVLILGGMQLLVMGVLGEYLGRVYEETKQRPVYVVGARYGLEHDAHQQAPAPSLL